MLIGARLASLRNISHRLWIKSSNPFAGTTRRIGSRPVELDCRFALDVIRFEQDNYQALTQSYILLRKARQCAEASKSYLRECCVGRILDRIEIGIDARQRHLVQLGVIWATKLRNIIAQSFAENWRRGSLCGRMAGYGINKNTPRKAPPDRAQLLRPAPLSEKLKA